MQFVYELQFQRKTLSQTQTKTEFKWKRKSERQRSPHYRRRCHVQEVPRGQQCGLCGRTHTSTCFHSTKTHKLITLLLVVRCRSAPRCWKPFSYWRGVFRPWITAVRARPCPAHLCSSSANHRRSPATDALLIGWCVCSRLAFFSRKSCSSDIYWCYGGHWCRGNQPRSTLQSVLTSCTPVGFFFLPSSPCTQPFLCCEWHQTIEWWDLNPSNVKFHLISIFSLEVCRVRNVSHIGPGFTAEVRWILEVLWSKLQKNKHAATSHFVY